MATYERDGYTVDQVGNNHVWIFKNTLPVAHINCDKQLDEQGLAALLDEVLILIEGAKDNGKDTRN